jgi:O-succinylbenzoic acid--CoA ligase
MRESWLGNNPWDIEKLRRALSDALDGGSTVLPLDASAPHSRELLAAMAPDQEIEPDTAVIIATSGSTGAPKGVLLSAGALIASATATLDRLGGSGNWLLAIPAFYIGGLQVVVRSLLSKSFLATLPAGKFDPETFAQTAASIFSRPGASYTALVPTQLIRLLDTGGTGLAAARRFDRIIVGAAAMSETLWERSRQAELSVVSTYGMSETASGCVYNGQPLSGARATLDENRQILLAGPMLSHGYRLQPGLTRESFSDGWFHTKDFGRFTADGKLEVLGRVDDVINTGGVKVSAASIERELMRVPGVRETVVVGVKDAEWGEVVAAMVVPDPAGQVPDRAELRARVREILGVAAVPKRIEFRDELPLLGSGKIDKAAVRGFFA